MFSSPSQAAMAFYPVAVTSANNGANSVGEDAMTDRLKRPKNKSKAINHLIDEAPPPPPLMSPTLRRLSSLLLAILHNPSILASFIAQLDWLDLYPLLCSCKGLYDIFRDIPLRDVVLSRFVQGYGFCLRHRDMLLYQDVPITAHDLDLLLISQHAPLPSYPTHALHVLSVFYPSIQDDFITAKLVALTQAHSRFVLLFQSLVHSSLNPIPIDPPEDPSVLNKARSKLSPVRELTFPAPLAYAPQLPPQPAPNDRPLPPTPSHRRFSLSLLAGPPINGRIRSKHKHSRSHPSSLSEPASPPANRLHHKRPYSYTSVGMTNLLATHQQIESTNSTTTVDEPHQMNECLPLRRLSIWVKNQSSPPHPLPEEPKALKMYSNKWRRSTSVRSKPRHGHSLSLSDTYTGTIFDSRLVDESDFTELERPRRHFAYEHHRRSPSNNSGIDYNNSSQSSISAVSRSSWNNNNIGHRPGTDSPSGSLASNNSSPPLSTLGRYANHQQNGFMGAYPNGNGNNTYPVTNTIYTSPSPFIVGGGGYRSSPPTSLISTSSSIHDLLLATSRNRAPILRVYIPTHHLSPPSIEACERQLQESGLWEHLSTGDVVCNFGFIPGGEGEEEKDEEKDEEKEGRGGGGIVRRPSLVYPLTSSYNNLNTAAAPSSPNPNNNNNNEFERKKWLIFDGHSLVPYTPPDLLPLSEPLHLPTPFYYHHIMPAFSNPQFIITRLPPVLRSGKSSFPSSPTSPTQQQHAFDSPPSSPAIIPLASTPTPTLTLLPTTSQMPSPHSPSGLALVNRYAWTARVVRTRLPDEAEVGEGWFGEWIVEYEGTKEGRRLLVDALKGKMMGKRVCEVVRERSGGGRLWFRILP